MTATAFNLDALRPSLRPFDNQNRITSDLTTLQNQSTIYYTNVTTQPTLYLTVQLRISIFLDNSSVQNVFLQFQFRKNYPTTAPYVQLILSENQQLLPNQYVRSDRQVLTPLLAAWSSGTTFQKVIPEIRTEFSRNFTFKLKYGFRTFSLYLKFILFHTLRSSFHARFFNETQIKQSTIDERNSSTISELEVSLILIVYPSTIYKK